MLIFLSILGYFRQFKTISEVFVTFLMDIFGYFENIKFTLGAEVLSTFCSCLSYRLQILRGSSYELSNQIIMYKSEQEQKVLKTSAPRVILCFQNIQKYPLKSHKNLKKLS